MTSYPTGARHKDPPFSLIALLALAVGACSDSTSPTSPEAAESVSAQTVTALKAPRTAYIADLKLHLVYIDIGPDGTYDNGIDLQLTNPGPQADGFYLWATLQNSHQYVDGGSIETNCQAPLGVLNKGTCRTMFFVVPPPTSFELGAAKLTVYLMQRVKQDSYEVAAPSSSLTRARSPARRVTIWWEPFDAVVVNPSCDFRYVLPPGAREPDDPV